MGQDEINDQSRQILSILTDVGDLERTKIEPRVNVTHTLVARTEMPQEEEEQEEQESFGWPNSMKASSFLSDVYLSACPALPWPAVLCLARVAVAAVTAVTAAVAVAATVVVLFLVLSLVGERHRRRRRRAGRAENGRSLSRQSLGERRCRSIHGKAKVKAEAKAEAADGHGRGGRGGEEAGSGGGVDFFLRSRPRRPRRSILVRRCVRTAEASIILGKHSESELSNIT